MLEGLAPIGGGLPEQLGSKAFGEEKEELPKFARQEMPLSLLFFFDTL
jgi:hypothetical protein